MCDPRKLISLMGSERAARGTEGVIRCTGIEGCL